MLLRVPWGVFGSRNARLVGLVSGPAAVYRHFVRPPHRDVPPERGHHAAGGWAGPAIVVMHIAMIAIHGIRGRRNLVAPTITGRAREVPAAAEPAAGSPARQPRRVPLEHMDVVPGREQRVGGA